MALIQIVYLRWGVSGTKAHTSLGDISIDQEPKMTYLLGGG